MMLRRAMTLLATLVAALPATVLIGISWSPGTASACSCMMHTDESAYVDADVVFVGTLTEIVPPEPEADGSWRSDALERFVFEVSAVHKGEAMEHQVVVTAADGASCGLELPPGGPYLMFARSSGEPGSRDGELSSSLCSGLRPASERDALPPRTTFPRPSSPTPPTPPRPTPPRPAPPRPAPPMAGRPTRNLATRNPATQARARSTRTMTTVRIPSGSSPSSPDHSSSGPARSSSRPGRRCAHAAEPLTERMPGTLRTQWT